MLQKRALCSESDLEPGPRPRHRVTPKAMLEPPAKRPQWPQSSLDEMQALLPIHHRIGDKLPIEGG